MSDFLETASLFLISVPQSTWILIGSGACALLLLLAVVRRLRKKRALLKGKLLKQTEEPTLFGPDLDHADMPHWLDASHRIFAHTEFVRDLEPLLKQHYDQHPDLSRADMKKLLLDNFSLKTEKLNEWLKQKPLMIFCLGVNGSGKTTTIAKLIYLLENHYHISKDKIIVIGTDTFRAAAMDQLKQKLSDIKVDVFVSNDANKPSTALYQGIEQAKGKEVILVDTSGRLHTDHNLRQELKLLIEKGHQWLSQQSDQASTKSILICDATHGYNLSSQIKTFGEDIPLHAILWTKWDCVKNKAPLYANLIQHQVPLLAVGTGEEPKHIEYLDHKQFLETLIP